MEQQQEPVEGFEWRRILLPEELDWSFLGEVAFRTFFMFMLLLLFFKLSGKRSIYQLSLFEIALIVGLGSAAGDPMFYDDVGLLPVIIVFVIISLLYRALIYLTSKNETAEKIIEGRVDPLFRNDLLVYENLDSESLSYDEFFGFLRNLHVEHLGQIRLAYLEINGDISVFFYPDDMVKPGLPILPEALNFYYSEIVTEGFHSCARCGYTAIFKAGETPECSVCKTTKWIRSFTSKRLA